MPDICYFVQGGTCLRFSLKKGVELDLETTLKVLEKTNPNNNSSQDTPNQKGNKNNKNTKKQPKYEPVLVPNEEQRLESLKSPETAPHKIFKKMENLMNKDPTETLEMAPKEPGSPQFTQKADPTENDREAEIAESEVPEEDLEHHHMVGRAQGYQIVINHYSKSSKSDNGVETEKQRQQLSNWFKDDYEDDLNPLEEKSNIMNFFGAEKCTSVVTKRSFDPFKRKSERRFVDSKNSGFFKMMSCLCKPEVE